MFCRGISHCTSNTLRLTAAMASRRGRTAPAAANKVDDESKPSTAAPERPLKRTKTQGTSKQAAAQAASAAASEQAGESRPSYWLMKSEPDVFSIDDLAAKPEQTEHWDGACACRGRGREARHRTPCSMLPLACSRQCCCAQHWTGSACITMHRFLQRKNMWEAILLQPASTPTSTFTMPACWGHSRATFVPMEHATARMPRCTAQHPSTYTRRRALAPGQKSVAEHAGRGPSLLLPLQRQAARRCGHRRGGRPPLMEPVCCAGRRRIACRRAPPGPAPPSLRRHRPRHGGAVPGSPSAATYGGMRRLAFLAGFRLQNAPYPASGAIWHSHPAWDRRS